MSVNITAADVKKLREMTGARVEVRGTLTRCDAFSGTIFLSDGLIEPVSN